MMVYTFKRWFESFEATVVKLYQTVVSFVKVLVLTKGGLRLPEVKAERCYILGNGPSLKSSFEQNADLLKNSTLVCVNNFPSTDKYEEYKPSHLVLHDLAFYQKDASKRLEVVTKTWEAMVSKTTWPIWVHVPVLGRSSGVFEELARKNPNLNVVYYNYTIVEGFDTVSQWMYNKGWGMPRCQNVLGSAIFLCLNMHFKEIFILGADHSWANDVVVDEDNDICIKHTHFYSDPDKPIVGKLYHAMNPEVKVNMVGFYTNIVKAFAVYYILERYAKVKAAKVYNASTSSLIDAFTRVRI